MSRYIKIKVDLDELGVIIRNVDSWERFMNVKFIEADITGNKATITAMPVATPGFFVWVQNGEARLMAEVVSKSRVGYVDLEELAEFDVNLMERLKHIVVCKDNNASIDRDGRYFPKSQESVELYKMLMKTAKWK